MSWIQQNKFLAGLAGATAVIGGAIFFFGNSQGNQYEDNLAEYQALKDEFRKLQKSTPYPSNNNLQDKEAIIASYEEVIEDVRMTFSGFNPGKVQEITPQEFSNLRVKMDKELRDVFTSAEIALPADTAFGFETYKSSPPRPQATGMLKYELGAVQWLLSQLAAAKPSEVNNILRNQLDVESRQVAAPAPPKPGRQGKRARRGAEKPPVKAYTLMPMELAFTGSESSVREFLQAMVNSKDYFFSIRALRIRNEKQTPPNVKDARFPEKKRPAGPAGGFGDGADPFAGIDLPGDGAEGAAAEGTVPVPKPAAGKNDRILIKVLGGEKLHVFIRFDIVFIQDQSDSPKPTPRVK